MPPFPCAPELHLEPRVAVKKSDRTEATMT